MTEPETTTPVSQLVVIGASAGGVEALLTLVESLPVGFPAPIVVAQHLAPERPSQLASLVASHTRLAVRTVQSSEALAPGTIYVVPADRDVEISDHRVDVRQQPGRTPKPSVDRLLATAARAFGDGLISVILTGTGSDGAAGAQATKAYGGTVIVQNPETARFPGMPLAVSHFSVDIVADLEAIGPLLTDLVTGNYALPISADDELRPFLDQIRERTNLDFSAYKRPTIFRRLQRRMAAVGVATLVEYQRYIDRHPDELQRLVASILIKVTHFFRDPELFDYLRERVLPELIAEARQRGELRLWSAGCATGEEAYSLAMLVADILGDELESLPVRIFATDVAAEAVDFARRGIYPESAVEGLPPDLVERYFIPLNGACEVRKAIRGMIIFGDHDLGHRASFPRIDLILCRNVLIYFTSELQRRSLQLFAFSLRPGGYLALGKSESVSPFPEYFAQEQPRLKLFRRIGAAVPLPINQVLSVAPLDASFRTTGRSPARRLAPRESVSLEPPPLIHRADRALDAIAAGVITVNRDYDMLTINTAARRLLGIRTAAIGQDLIHGVAPALGATLRAAVDAALRGETTTMIQPLPRDPVEGEGRYVQIVCTPTTEAASVEIDAVLVEITDVGALVQRASELEATIGRLEASQREREEQLATAVAELRQLRAVNQDLAVEQGRLRSEVELLQVAQEEAQAAAEEIETLSEEQQATNEELETVNEELQATNEELQATVGELSVTNDELFNRTNELEQATQTLEEQRLAGEAERSRLAAILTNMGDAVLVVGPSGETMLTNEAFDRLFGSVDGLVPEDESGRSLPAETWPQRRAVQGEAFTLSFTMPGPNGTRRWFETNGQPIHGSDGQLWGVVVIRDITERSLRRQQEQFLAVAAHELRTPLTVLSGRLQLLARRMAGGRSREQLQDDAARALDQAHQLESHVNELMDAARLQFGQMTLERGPVDLAAVVRGVAETAETLAAGQAIVLDLPEGSVMVDGDMHRLERVLLNLLTNAITYAAGTERIDVHLTREEGMARIDVADTGPGIPAEALPHIFTRFFQLEHQDRTVRSGLGLGLFIAREIVTAHGGTLEAASTVGQGTTMTIRLPLRAEEGDPPAAAAAPTAAHAPTKDRKRKRASA
jgi:two-component system CheB/CheR fusion protein